MSDYIFYPAIALTGGTDGALDKYPAADLVAGDTAIAITSTGFYHYILDTTSGAAESSPDVIKPDDATGATADYRWLLKNVIDNHVHDARYYTETELNAGQLDNQYFQESEHLNASAGAGDAGKPIKLDAGGKVDATMVNDGDIDHTAITNIGSNAHSVIDTHLAADAKHRLINDVGSTATDLFSADKINTEVATKIGNVVEDTTPQLGGDLDMNSKGIDFPTTVNITDCLDENNMVSDSATKLATQQSIKAYVDTEVATQIANVVEDTTPQLGGDLDMNSKAIDFPSTANISDVKDEDNMVSDSATMLATQQSIKKYVDDSKVATVGIVADTTPQLGGDLDMNSKGIDFPSTANITDVKDEDTLASDSATMLATQQSIKAYVDGRAVASSGCYVYRSTQQTMVEGAMDKVEFNAEVYDILGEYVASPNYRFTATTAGIYMVSSAVSLVGVTDGCRTFLSIYKNGVEYARGADFSTGAVSAIGPAVAVPIKLAATDYIEIWLYQDNAENTTEVTQNTAPTVYMIVQRM